MAHQSPCFPVARLTRFQVISLIIFTEKSEGGRGGRIAQQAHKSKLGQESGSSRDTQFDLR